MKVLFVALLLVGCSGTDDSIRANIASVTTHAVGTIVRFETLIPGDWDRVYVFGPYTSESAISECLGTEASSRLTQRISASDAHTLLVFEGGSGSLESVLIPRSGGDFGRESVGRWYERSSANFVVTEDASGWRELKRSGEASGTCNHGRK